MIVSGPLDGIGHGLRRLHWDAYVRAVQLRMLDGKSERWFMRQPPAPPSDEELVRQAMYAKFPGGLA